MITLITEIRKRLDLLETEVRGRPVGPPRESSCQESPDQSATPPKYSPGDVLRHKASGEKLVIVEVGPPDGSSFGWKISFDKTGVESTYQAFLDTCFERVEEKPYPEPERAFGKDPGWLRTVEACSVCLNFMVNRSEEPCSSCEVSNPSNWRPK
jgi:hypothetical protein